MTLNQQHREHQFVLSDAHLAALQDLVFVFAAADCDSELAPSLILDPLATFKGQAPGEVVAQWMGLSPKALSVAPHLRFEVIEFFFSLTDALNIAQQYMRTSLPEMKLEIKGSLAMMLGYGNPDTLQRQPQPHLDPTALNMILDLAKDPDHCFDDLSLLPSGTNNPIVGYRPAAYHLDLIRDLQFDWTWMDPDQDRLLSRFFSPVKHSSLIEYLERVPTITADLPIADQSPEPHGIESMELAMNAFLTSAQIQPALYGKSAQTEGRWLRFDRLPQPMTQSSAVRH